MLALVVYVGAQVVMHRWPRGSQTSKIAEGHPIEPSETPSPLSSRKPIQRFEVIATGDVFRTHKPAVPRKAVERQPVLQETKLNLQLKGTVVGEDSPSYAMILDGRTRQEEMYRVDEYVQGVRIEGIRRDGVILQGEKGREFLRLAEPELGAPSAKVPRAVQRRQRAASRQGDP